MDFSFIDSWQEETPPTATEAQTEGYKKLVEVAQNIPLLDWRYNGVDVPDTGEKIGIITQSLQHVPGLASMVNTDENGVQSYDAALLAGAALAAVSALARVVLNVPLSENYAQEPGENYASEENVNGNIRKNLDETVPTSTSTTV